MMKITDEMVYEISGAIALKHRHLSLEEAELRSVIAEVLKQVPVGLRDKLAAHALQGIIAKSPYASGTLAEMRASGDLEARAAAAYDYADAMLEARK